LESSDRRISLYLHVPFCTDKCLYCDFYSVPRHSVTRELQAKVVTETVRQAHAFLELLPGGPRIATIFMGGGTPSSLPRDLLRELLEPFSHARCDEWTVEANPESLDDEFLDICASSGATRLSVGVQSLRDDQLALLRRPATRRATLAALERAARRWNGELSVDYITGIPRQTTRQVTEDIEILKEFGPGHFSLYQLTVEPGTGLAAQADQGTIELNSPDQDEELWFAGKGALEGAGFRNYEISNFCLPGKECQHNIRYWRMEPYIGAGPAAVSTLPSEPFAGVLGEGAVSVAGSPVLRFSNPHDIQAFIGDPRRHWAMEVEEIAPRDFLLETLMMGLRLQEGIRCDSFEARFGRTFESVFPALWDAWVEKGMAVPHTAPGWGEASGGALRLSDRGRLLLDGLLKELAERLPSLDGLAVRWPY
jgi:oxygen-independent coproporphyrinogen III oxidase